MGMPNESFWCPDDVVEHMRAAGTRGRAARESWYATYENWTEKRAELDAALEGRGLDGWQDSLPVWEPGESVATRNAGKKVLNALLPVVPGLMGGGADLTGNCGVEIEGGVAFSRLNRDGRQLHFGVREHAMGSVMNGMAAHGGVLPFGGTFFVFADYMRPPVRLAALSDLHVIYSWTHDSVGVGEDGPTHQPIEHLASLRAMPKLRVLRPADANETAQAWRIAIEKGGPTALVLSRQNLPVLEGTAGNTAVELGAYILRNTATDPDVVLIGTGSEVSLCLATADQLEAEGISVRVVSMPCWELFMEQDDDYQRSILGDGIPRVSVEAGSTFGWALWADACVGIDHYGASAPGPQLMELFGMTVENVIEHVRLVLN
jgi:transketolase